MKWEIPPVIKIHEALGSIADARIEVEGNTAKVYSSSRDKYYNVEYDADANSIMMNDNGSYYKGYLGYPGIAFLMVKEVLPFNHEYAKALKGIKWKDINQQFKNDFDKTQKYVEDIMMQKGVDIEEFTVFCSEVLKKIENKQFNYLGNKKLPPKGY